MVHYLEEITAVTFLRPSTDGTLTDSSWHKLVLPLPLMRRAVTSHRDRTKLEVVPLVLFS